MFRRSKNSISITGYLKEDTLEKTRNEKGEDIISGSLIIMTEQNSEFRMQFYANRFKKIQPGETTPQANKYYTALEKFTKEQVTTFAKALAINPNATFESVKAQLTPIRAIGTTQEYLRKTKDNEFAPLITYKGLSAYTPKEELIIPKASFEVELYIDEIIEEKKDGDKTGRVIVKGLLPEYDDSVSVVDYVADKTLGDQILDNCKKGQTVTFLGDLVNNTKKVLKEKGKALFGREVADTYVTEFVNERQIMTCTEIANEEHEFKLEDIKAGMAIRQEKIDRLTTPQAKPTASAPTAGKITF